MYTPAQYACPPTVPWRDTDGLLSDPVDHYRKVAGTQVELTLLSHFIDLVLEERWGFPRRLDDKAATIKRETARTSREDVLEIGILKFRDVLVRVVVRMVAPRARPFPSKP